MAAHGQPWEILRPEYTQHVRFYGSTEFYRDSDGQERVRWVNTTSVLGVPYDTPIAGLWQRKRHPCACGARGASEVRPQRL